MIVEMSIHRDCDGDLNNWYDIDSLQFLDMSESDIEYVEKSLTTFEKSLKEDLYKIRKLKQKMKDKGLF